MRNLKFQNSRDDFQDGSKVFESLKVIFILVGTSELEITGTLPSVKLVMRGCDVYTRVWT